MARFSNLPDDTRGLFDLLIRVLALRLPEKDASTLSLARHPLLAELLLNFVLFHGDHELVVGHFCQFSLLDQLVKEPFKRKNQLRLLWWLQLLLVGDA